MTWAANPQQWALDAGLPNPEKDEPWIPYLFRLGLLDIDIEKLMVELTDRTADLLTYRFTDYLRKHGFQEQWNAYCRKRVDQWVTPQRRKELEEMGI